MVSIKPEVSQNGPLPSPACSCNREFHREKTLLQHIACYPDDGLNEISIGDESHSSSELSAHERYFSDVRFIHHDQV